MSFDILLKSVTELGEASKQRAKELRETFEQKHQSLESRFGTIEQKFGLYGGNTETKSFNQIIAETIEANADAIQRHRQGSGSVHFRLKGFDDKVETKAVGDMSIAANFPGSSGLTTDYRNPLIENPYNKIWLSDILPGGTSTGRSVYYPKENGGEGGAALWTDPTTDKAQMDFDITGETAHFKWIAGWAIVDRDMVDDIPWMTEYIQRRMLISLKTSENDLTLNGSTDTDPVQGMLDAATTYSGTFTKPVDRLIDAAFGQIPADTHEFYNPTHFILTHRDAVGVGLNTADGSGEYDLPQGTVRFVNGQLEIGGLNTVKTSLVGSGNFLAFDRSAVAFIRRMLPELRLFEDSALAKKNKIMFRIEGRATLAILNDKAIVKGALTPTP